MPVVSKAGVVSSNKPMGHDHANSLSAFFAVLLLVVAGLACNNQVTTQELLDANFLAKGQTPIDLLSPSENQQVTTANPTLSWSSKGVGLYSVQMATDANFSNIVLNKEVSGTSYTVANSDLIGVTSLTTASYYWKVRIARITNHLESKRGAFFLVAIPASGSGYAGALYVHGASDSSLQLGSKEAPYRTIQSAISAADALRNNKKDISLDILVAGGTYAEEVSLVPGISIRGGYASTALGTGEVLWTRNIAANPTTIQAPIDIAIKGGPAIAIGYTNTTWIEGFTVRGGTAWTSYGINLTRSSPTISNNIIHGGAAWSGATMGIYSYSSCPPAMCARAGWICLRSSPPTGTASPAQQLSPAVPQTLAKTGLFEYS